MKPETKFYKSVRKNLSQIQWTRLENLSGFGTPDLLGYNKSQRFFTLELKVTEGNKVRFSPHQISFHIRHPVNSFILVQPLAARCEKLGPFLYKGNRIEELAACGLKLEPLACGWQACSLLLDACGL